jgi:hypothetical protein
VTIGESIVRDQLLVHSGLSARNCLEVHKENWSEFGSCPNSAGPRRKKPELTRKTSTYCTSTDLLDYLSTCQRFLANHDVVTILRVVSNQTCLDRVWNE